MELTMESAKALLANYVTQPHLINHAIAVSAAMGAMAEYFGEDKLKWEIAGYLHDIDYEQHPEDHLDYTRAPLEEVGLPEDMIYAILSHGYTLRNEIEPKSNMDKSLFTVDELTGIVSATAKMRPNGITDLELASVKKKYKDKKFAAGCRREVIDMGCEMLGMPVDEVTAIVIEGMKAHAEELGLGAKE